HVDCVAADVKDTLGPYAGDIGYSWTPLKPTLAHHPYRVRRIDGETLASDPFRVLAEDPDARADMGNQTLVVLGWQFADGRPGFILLAGRANIFTANFGSGEELQDHGCAVLKR